MKIRNTLIALLSVFALGSMAPVEAHAARHHSSKKAVEAKSGKHAKAEKVSARSSRREKARHTAHAAPAVQRAAVASAGPEIDNEGNPLLHSAAFMIADQATGNVLLEKNSDAVLPIASITKLMTAVVVTEAQLPLDETLTISQEDVDTEKGSRSRLRVGTQLTREEMLHLALMSSENRAAHALGRQYPGGLDAFVSAMNAKAKLLGMSDTHYVEPTGLSSRNQSSAKDLATLVKAAYEHQIIRELSTSPEYSVAVGKRELQFRTTNALVRNPTWDIGLQKTGYISEAGRCLVMQAKMAGRQLIMVFLDSAGKYSRLGDAERVRRWVNDLGHVAPATTSSSATALIKPTT